MDLCRESLGGSPAKGSALFRCQVPQASDGLVEQSRRFQHSLQALETAGRSIVIRFQQQFAEQCRHGHVLHVFEGQAKLAGESFQVLLKITLHLPIKEGVFHIGQVT